MSKQLADGYKLKLGPMDTSALKALMGHLGPEESKSISKLLDTQEFKMKHDEIIEKNLSKVPEQYQRILKGIPQLVPMPHVQVRNKMRTRAAGSEPQQGDRVSFVILAGTGKLFEKAEDPVHAQEKSLKIDYQYYFTNQFKKPVCDLLEPLVGKNPEKVIFDQKTKQITEFFKVKEHKNTDN